jgi:hypothetical protein
MVRERCYREVWMHIAVEYQCYLSEAFYKRAQLEVWKEYKVEASCSH